jgi:tetratricopeptide (TPR) repeat protein
LRRALDLEPRQYEVRLELVSVHRALGDTVQATSQLALLKDARPSEPRVFYAAGAIAADRGDLDSAIRDFKEALRRDPGMFSAWHDLGLAYIKLERWQDAVETFAALTQRHSGSVDAAYLHALSLFNAGRGSDAERETRRTLRLNAGAAEAHTLLGVILASRGNANAEASEALAQAVALNPDSFDARLYAGRVHYALKQYPGAVKELEAAAKLNPAHPEARFFLGTALESAGESEKALFEYEQLVKIAPDSATGKLGLGALLVKKGKIDDAIAALNQSITLDPKNFEAHWALGRALALKERFTEAVAALTAAVSLAPHRADAHYQLGLVFRRLGRTEEAAREFAIVDRLNTEFRTGASQKQPEKQ